MDFKFKKENADGEASAQPQEKKSQTAMLVLLLLLLGGFGYLYFFTGLIRPQEQPPAPQPPPQIVKQPLPARDAATPAVPAKPEDQKTPVAAAPVAGAPAPAAPVAAAKPSDPKAVQPPAAKPEERKPAAAKPAVAPVPAKPAVPAAKQPEPAKPAVAAAKPEEKKPAPAKADDKQAAVAKKEAQPKQAEPARKAVAPKKTGPWTVVAGYYVVEELLVADMAKVKRAGFTPLMTSGPKRPVAMNRLFYGEYGSKAEAQQAVEQLKRTAGSGFSTQHGDKHEVYVGSYAVLSGAQSEQQRLASAGVKVSIKKSQVPVASRKLTAGTFTDRKAADEALKKLKAAGMTAAVLE